MVDVTGSKARRVQIKATRKDGWTKARRTKFLRVLAATCNVTAAGRAVGKSVCAARELRKRDGEFSRLWQEALEAGYERLENELLARALGQGAIADNPDLEEVLATPEALPDFDPQLAITLLKLRGNLAGQGRAGAGKRGPDRSVRRTQGEIDAALLRQIDTIVAQRT